MIPEEGCTVAKMMVLKPEDEIEVNPRVWAEKGKRGLLYISPIENKMKPGIPPIRISAGISPINICRRKSRVNTNN